MLAQVHSFAGTRHVNKFAIAIRSALGYPMYKI